MDMSNKDKLDEFLKELTDWANNEVKTKGYIFESEVQERLTEENRKFIKNEIKKPWKRPNDEG